MFEYAVLLFVLSILLLFLYLRFKDKIPLSPRVVYCTLGISFTLGLFFPLVVARTSAGGIIFVYSLLIVLSSAALCFLENRASTNVSPEPLKVSELEMMQNAAQNPEVPENVPWEEEAGRPESFDELLSEELADDWHQTEGAGETQREETEEEQLERQNELPAQKQAGPVETEEETPKGETGALFYGQEGEEPAAGEIELAGRDGPGQTPDLPAAAETGETEIEGDAGAGDWITAGFAAKNRGDFTKALTCFFKALAQSPGAEAKALIALEISSIYQELGQYAQAALALKAITQDLPLEGTIGERISHQLVYLEKLEALLEAAKIKGAPYSKVPSLIKIKANLETCEKLKTQ